MTLTGGGDLNIVGAANGYEIGTNYVLWNNGDNTNIFAGVGAGSAAVTGGYNTIIGNLAGTALTGGQFNTYIGNQAGSSDQNGVCNTFIGYGAGSNTQGCTSCSPPTGDFNTMVGIGCGLHNVNGYGNSYYGKLAAYSNDGHMNCMYGGHSGDGNISTDSNSFFGTYSNYYGTAGQYNVYIGMDAAVHSGDGTLNYPSSNYNVYAGGEVAHNNPGGNYNLLLGYRADAYTLSGGNPASITNAIAIGADAWVQHNNQIILGNNSQMVGIGMNLHQTGPMANLEIRTDSTPAPVTVGTYGYIGAGHYYSTNYYVNSYPYSSGFSGLKFWDLNSKSIPVDPTSSNFNNETNPYPSGLLSIDGYGNVIYVPAPTVTMGTCSSPTVLDATYGGAINMNNQNFNFSGNGAGYAVNNVGIGLSSCTTPNAKLEVDQGSTSNNTTAEFVENQDFSNGYSGSPQPLIGVESFIPAPPWSEFYNVAGWFEADDYTGNPLTAPQRQYAIFVPSGGGTVDIGYPFATDQPNTYLLKVNSYAWINGVAVGSDSMLKKNVTPFKYGLKAIRKLNPVSYKYNGIGGFDTTGNYIGLIAQNLQRNVPTAVKQSKIIKDTITRDTATILSIYEEGVLYTAVNAIKELDSTVTAKNTTIDSLRTTLDSLRNAVQGMQTCLTQLCNNGHGAIHHHGGSNSDDSSTTITNVQDVTLSAMSETPVLYQNSPNPFSTGTKINYYLPANVQGATIVFYDSYGNQLKTVQLSQTGNGTLNITPDNLTSGIYSYSLVVNGNVIDTKRMLLQK